MDKRYVAGDYEDEIYRKWEKAGAFKPKLKVKSEKLKVAGSKDRSQKEKQTFTIIMPPPNANDPLHVGHAMFVALEDIMIRYQRMQGKAALWLPGTDHAGIETQFVFEKKLKKQGKSRFDFDREILYDMIWDYVQENSDVAVNQIKKLGASADWSRFKFMLDEDIVEVVIDTFKKLADDGLVYRDIRLVNYCTSCGTGFSDLEVNHVARKSPLYFIKYGPFTLATVRPETKFGDTAVAVNPKDKRYSKYIGKKIKVKGLLGELEMVVLADDYVDPEFGTGVIKVTPMHDPNDYEIWQRHREQMPEPIQVIDFEGKLNERTGKYQGLWVDEARKVVVADLQEAGLLNKIDKNYEHTVSVCYRCGAVIEPLPLPQFYIKVEPLTKPVLKALEGKKVVVYGSGHDKILKHWLRNLKDWNVSRQIVWGIRMPVWYCKDSMASATPGGAIRPLTGESFPPLGACYVVSKDKPDKCEKCGAEDFVQETDTFDTWFSSAQWPYATLMSRVSSHLGGVHAHTVRGATSDFEKFYPTDVMETGYDILPFWVMRMLMMGLYRTGKVPFRTVYLHGLIRDEKGQKMSKSKGNVINPLDMVDKYGADALRMALVIRSTPGQDKGVGEGDIKGMRNLTNKIWNAARFIILQNGSSHSGRGHSATHRRVFRQIPNGKQMPNVETQISKQDKEFLEKLDGVVAEVTKQLDEYRIGLAAETVYNEFWHWFCDDWIESNKRQETSDKALLYGLITFLKLLHPFVPFVTEAVWGELRLQLQVTSYKLQDLFDSEMLIEARWPTEELKVKSEK